MRKTIAGFFLAAAVAAAGSAQAEQPVEHPAGQVVLKAAHFWPPSAMAPTKVLGPWCDRIAAASDNRMVCRIYPAMQLGGTPPQLIGQAADGVADIVWTLPGYTAGRFPSVEAFELPFLIKRAEPASRALWDYCEKYCRDDFKGVKPLAFNVHDPGYIHSNRRPIRVLADFRGMKMRAPTRMSNRLLAALGATPVALPLPALPDALSKGVIDGYLLPWEVIPPMKLEEMTEHHTETDPASPALYTATFILAMNRARYDGLPADLKRIIDDHSGAELSAAAGRAWDESARAARAAAAAAGGAFHVIPAAELAAWRGIGDRLTTAWIAEMTGKGRDGRAMVDAARALIDGYSAR